MCQAPPTTKRRRFILAFLLCACAEGVVLHSTSPCHPASPGVVVLTHYDKPDWREKCEPLLFSLRQSSVDLIVGYLDEGTFAGAQRRHAECLKSPVCAQLERSSVFNNMNKFIWAHEVLTSRELVHPDSLVVFADCTDTYLMCSAAELERKFEAFGAGIVHGAELNLWPRDRLHQLIQKRVVEDPYPASPTPLRYGNAGQYAGRARDVVRYFERQRHAWEDGRPWTWCCPMGARYALPPGHGGSGENETDCYNDQRCIHTYVSAGFHRVAVFDHIADFFLNANKMAPRISVVGARIHFNLSQAAGLQASPAQRRQADKQVWLAPREVSMPCWFHCPGSAKWLYPRITSVLMRAAELIS